MVDVTVTIPKWLYDAAIEKGLDLLALLQEALLKKLDKKSDPNKVALY